jgi:hypothetical protein
MEFVEFFRDLESMGMVDALLPFILIFTIIFAMLQKTNLLGSGKRNFNVVVAGVIALLIVIPHVTMGGTCRDRDSRLSNGLPDAVCIINNALPQVSIIVIAILMALLLIGILGGEAKWMGGGLSGFIAIAAFLAIVYIFGAQLNWWQDITTRWNWWTSETTSVIIIILVFALVIWYITREPTASDKAGGFSQALGKFGDMFKK